MNLYAPCPALTFSAELSALNCAVRRNGSMGGPCWRPQNREEEDILRRVVVAGGFLRETNSISVSVERYRYSHRLLHARSDETQVRLKRVLYFLSIRTLYALYNTV